jgi:hypothetical protein
VNAKYGVEFGENKVQVRYNLTLLHPIFMAKTSYFLSKEGEEQQYIYSDYKNLFNLEAHRANKSKDELASLRYEMECKCG